MTDLGAVPQLGKGLRWEDMKEGDRFRTASRTITESDLIHFITSMGFTEALFFDASHAAEAALDKKQWPAALKEMATVIDLLMDGLQKHRLASAREAAAKKGAGNHVEPGVGAKNEKNEKREKGEE